MRLYLIRHGQTAWNAEARAQGHSDIPLDPIGAGQARALGESFRGVDVDRILVSDLARAVETARPIADTLGIPMELDPVLRERSFGDWEGQIFAEIALNFEQMASEQGVDRFSVKPPSGESFEDVWDRLGPVVRRLETVERPTVVVTHGGTCSLLLARLIQGTIATSRAFRFHNTAVTELNRNHDGLWQLSRYDDRSHLAVAALSGGADGSNR